jgi:serine/threonine protein phosphatase 1
VPDDKFAVLRRASRVWVVPALHGQVQPLSALHDELWPRFIEGDRLVYLGNYLGHAATVTAAIDELLRFRCAVIARPRMFAFDVVYLRGAQEEMWEKLLQLQFAVNPREVYDWMLTQGAAATIRAYGGDIERGRIAMRDGPVAIGRWTASLRNAVAQHPGHRALMSALRRAAYTDDKRLLFVHAGVDPSRPLDKQGDALWWGHSGWGRIDSPYQGFRRIVRGFARDARTRDSAPAEGGFTLTVDAGCGFGGPLVALCLSPDGEIVDRIEAAA